MRPGKGVCDGEARTQGIRRDQDRGGLESRRGGPIPRLDYSDPHRSEAAPTLSSRIQVLSQLREVVWSSSAMGPKTSSGSSLQLRRACRVWTSSVKSLSVIVFFFEQLLAISVAMDAVSALHYALAARFSSPMLPLDLHNDRDLTPLRWWAV